MPKKILVINGHPDPRPERFVHALAAAYAEGAEAGGHEVRRLAIGELDIPVLRRREDWENGPVPQPLSDAAGSIAWADHLVIVYPLWLGDVPALLKAFLEQLGRPGVAIDKGARSLAPGLWKGKSARLVVTMGMPAFVYNWYFGAHSVKSLKRNILNFVGISPVRSSIVGMVEGAADSRAEWLETMRTLGRKAQ
ncbi:NAD(P)H-dependent oxidoreductase [Mesorhizobium australicum]|uniref:Putative NADPH-quinone reductase (Modulator of drug activity B) n=1 Tax=Mesorhizobium australicum TaxID=536018 RepID=A0A1X7NWP4_9HYPH|nr:NAD(P)H-dependent oxidoreductase [Mesorhizobium australicum]SMH41911.1 Putative NADPH-quinone reductase (modulator of drug activity B) [Mesorhizobium australicum]